MQITVRTTGTKFHIVKPRGKCPHLKTAVFRQNLIEVEFDENEPDALEAFVVTEEDAYLDQDDICQLCKRSLLKQGAIHG